MNLSFMPPPATPSQLSAALWVLGDGKAGHENQSLGIAGHLGAAPTLFRVPWGKDARYYAQLLWAFASLLPGLGPVMARWRLGRTGPLCLPPLPGEVPRLVISTGALPLPLLVMLRRGLGVNTVAVMARRPFPTSVFGAVVAHRHGPPTGETAEIEVLGAPNRLGLPPSGPAPFEEEVRSACAHHGQGPFVALVVGGPADWLNSGEAPFVELARAAGGLPHPLLITTSRRTPPAVEDALATLSPAQAPFCLLAGRRAGNPIAAMLTRSAVCVVSGESISMVSECLTAQKPVVVVKVWPHQPTGRAQKFARFLDYLSEQGYVVLATPATLPQAIAQALGEGLRQPFPDAAAQTARALRQRGLWP